MKNKCEYIDKDSGCLVSFDGSCCKEECFTYRLLQLLQAKEQENKRLLDIINAKPLETVDIDSAFEIEKLKEQLQAKEQECEGLKENQKLKHDNGYEVGALEKTIYNLKAENNLFRIGHDNEQARRRKYEQALVEIKEICKTNVCKHCHSKLKVDDNYCKNIKDCDCYNILQKISEVVE